jgi:plastocyanin
MPPRIHYRGGTVVRKVLAFVAIAIPLTFAACGGDDESSTTAASATGATSTEASTTDSSGSGAESGGVAISETEFALDPSDPSTKAGSVTFDVTNDGSTVHDLEVEGNGVEESTDPIEAGGNAKLTVDLEPGTYEIYCNIADHRDQGMEGTLTVQ